MARSFQPSSSLSYQRNGWRQIRFVRREYKHQGGQKGTQGKFGKSLCQQSGTSRNSRPEVFCEKGVRENSAQESLKDMEVSEMLKIF